MREPLVHFLAAGFALFALYAVIEPARYTADVSHRIELSATDVERLELAFFARWQRRPTAAELSGLIASEMRTEILSREAIALGLDKDDVIVKRRLAQKMEFVADDVSTLREPSREELRAWFARNKDDFAQPSRITFRHVFFSTDRRGPDAESAARKALAAVASRSTAMPRGDPFMYQDRYSARTAQQVAGEFGSDFANAVFSAPVGRWVGPVASGLGWHLVWTEELEAGAVPAYEDVEPEARVRWTTEQREAAKRATIEAMLSRYEVVMPAAIGKVSATGPRAASTP